MTDSPARPAAPYGAIASIAACSLIWGTTWYAITLQFGTVDPLLSVAYRFALAAVVLFAWCVLRRLPVRLSGAQHLAVALQGLLVFAVQYPLVYIAEKTVPSAVVAVIFAALAFVNLALFRLLLGQTAQRAAWAGALLGMAGVAALFVGELRRTAFDAAALAGLGIAVAAVFVSAGGNLAAFKAQEKGAPVVASTAWAMAYGAAAVAIFATASGVEWRFEMTPRYVLSLLYLSLFGSTLAFGLYFALARARGYALASYISALTPPVAVVVSVLMEGARFGAEAYLGLALVLAGQGLMIRAARASAAA
ncbi:MAG TPA: EamA family transporter [Phenylobacterium sp.]|nr:EamA family transporter [Phenylobacterium sp.]